ncbi:DUF6345 domain-containing protein [Actinoplanes sp. NPDC051513]|uniref:DUF6345 domain-containing protein n=1 Tax=Actinoplanes sp. NPDC051513 TaxID=3363908 RepID=UPI0037B2AFB9
MATLPIYRVRNAEAGFGRAVDLATGLHGQGNFTIRKFTDRTVVRSGDRVLEAAGSGSWAADTSRLWRLGATPPQLPDPVEAGKTADEYLLKYGLAPRLGDGFGFGRSGTGGSFASVRTDGKRDDQQLDVKVNYAVTVRLDEPFEGAREVPIIGGGGKTIVTVGDKGDVLSHLAAWREIESSFAAEVVPREKADAQFKAMTRAFKVLDLEVGLAYFSAPVFAGQEFLYPVYTYRATLGRGERSFPARVIMLPATTFGPEPPKAEPQPPRKRGGPAFERGERRGYASAVANPFEAGTSWIGPLGGLNGSPANAQGFVDELAADGWLINFNWGDQNAWESDWRRNDDDWVDAADFVFYTGHADGNGWVLSSPDDGSLDFTEVGTSPGNPGDLWGQNDLEWVVVAACGPLEDEILAKGGGDVFDRWDGAFDGLHSLMGYGAVTFDTTDEGGRLVRYAKDGMPLIDAWLRTGQEIQPSTNGWGAPFGPTVWVGAMYVATAGADPRFDHLWGHGSVSADPRNPTSYVAMWTTC